LVYQKRTYAVWRYWRGQRWAPALQHDIELSEDDRTIANFTSDWVLAPGQVLSNSFPFCKDPVMNARPLVLLIALLSLASNVVSTELELSLMTYNLRLDIASDGPNQWSERRTALADQIVFLAPEVLGLQEALPQQLAYLEQRLPAYAYLGVGRDGGDKVGEHTAIFYQADRLRVLSSATFWLSEHPTIPSMGWDAAYPRVSAPTLDSGIWAPGVSSGSSTPISTTRGCKPGWREPNSC
jgi:hypothetical protein